MDSKKAYEKYAGKKVVNESGVRLTICGYALNGIWLIGAYPSKSTFKGWPMGGLGTGDVLCTHFGNTNGYWYIKVEDVTVEDVTEQVRNPFSKLLQWIKKVF